MGDQVMVDLTGDVDMSKVGMVFDNPAILQEFSNIANSVTMEEFLKIVPEGDLITSRKVKWVPLFNCLKQEIFNGMVKEINALWKNENMHQQLEAIEKQKQKFSDVTTDQKLWRPQLSNVKAQLRAVDVANLQQQKAMLELRAKESEDLVNRMKKTVTAKRAYMKALQMDIQKCQKKNDDLISKVSKDIENHDLLMNINAD